MKKPNLTLLENYKITKKSNENQQYANEKSMSLEGKTMTVLAEEVNDHDSSLITGRLDNSSVVHFKGTEDMIGNLYQVHLDECKGFYYYGSIVE